MNFAQKREICGQKTFKYNEKLNRNLKINNTIVLFSSDDINKKLIVSIVYSHRIQCHLLYMSFICIPFILPHQLTCGIVTQTGLFHK